MRMECLLKPTNLLTNATAPITLAMGDCKQPHAAILSSPGMGFLIPLAQLARQLVLHHNFSVTLISHTIDSLQKTQNTILDTLPKAVECVSLPPVPSQHIPVDAKGETLISITQKSSIPSLRHVLNTLSSTHRVVALVVDLFGTDAFDVARELGLPPYILYTSPFMALSLNLYLPELDSAFSCETEQFTEPVKLPGCRPIQREDLLEAALDRSNEAYRWVLHHGRRYKEAKGILVNSIGELEPETLMRLKEEPSHPPIYPVGPLVQAGSGSTGGSDTDRPYWLRWLDDQPRGSVLLVSFGSGGALSFDQMKELALGLEMSEQRFLWVVRKPNDEESCATYFGVKNCREEEPLDFLPKGFMTRIRAKGVGHVVPWWAPQIQVLSHGSTGGFMSHCGWNSTLESMVHGVGMIAWPLYAEQKMNALLLVEDLKVALRPIVSEIEGGLPLVRREEIARVVKELLRGGEVGKRVQMRMLELKDACTKALAEDGSSNRAFSEVLSEWRR